MIIETAKSRQIEGASLLTDMERNLISVDLNLNGLETTLYIEDLIVTDENGYIILESNSQECSPVHINKEKILEVYEDLYDSNQIVIDLIDNGMITISKI